MSAPPPVAGLLPQQGAMRLLSRVLAAGPDGAVAEAIVDPAWPSCTADGADPALAVELIAQAAAAWLALREPGSGPETGLLVGVSRAHLGGDRLRPGAVLEIEVREGWHRDRLCQVQGRVVSAGVEVATAEVQVLRGPGALHAPAAESEGT